MLGCPSSEETQPAALSVFGVTTLFVQNYGVGAAPRHRVCQSWGRITKTGAAHDPEYESASPSTRQNGALVDVMFSEHRDMAAAKAFFQSPAVADVIPDRGDHGWPRQLPARDPENLGEGVKHRTSCYSTMTGAGSPWSCPDGATTSASKVDTSRCVGSSAHDRLTGSVEATTNCVTSSVPAPALINKLPPTPAGSSSSVALRP